MDGKSEPSAVEPQAVSDVSGRQAGVEKTLDLLRAELRMVMAQMGTARRRDIETSRLAEPF